MVYRINDSDDFCRGDEIDHYYADLGFYGVWTEKSHSNSLKQVSSDEIPIYTKYLSGMTTDYQLKEALSEIDLDRLLRTMEKLYNSRVSNSTTLTDRQATLLNDVKELLNAGRKDIHNILVSAKYVYMLITFNAMQHVEEIGG